MNWKATTLVLAGFVAGVVYTACAGGGGGDDSVLPGVGDSWAGTTDGGGDSVLYVSLWTPNMLGLKGIDPEDWGTFDAAGVWRYGECWKVLSTKEDAYAIDMSGCCPTGYQAVGWTVGGDGLACIKAT